MTAVHPPRGGGGRWQRTGALIAAIGSHCAWVVETAWLGCQPPGCVPGCGHQWWLANLHHTLVQMLQKKCSKISCFQLGVYLDRFKPPVFTVEV